MPTDSTDAGTHRALVHAMDADAVVAMSRARRSFPASATGRAPPRGAGASVSTWQPMATSLGAAERACAPTGTSAASLRWATMQPSDGTCWSRVTRARRAVTRRRWSTGDRSGLAQSSRHHPQSQLHRHVPLHLAPPSPARRSSIPPPQLANVATLQSSPPATTVRNNNSRAIQQNQTTAPYCRHECAATSDRGRRGADHGCRGG